MSNHQTLLLFAFRLFGLLLGALLTVLLARLLQPKAFGQYALILAMINVVALPLIVGLRHVLVRETAYALAQDNPTRAAVVWRWSVMTSVRLIALMSAILTAWILIGGSGSVPNVQLLAAFLIFLLMPAPHLFSGLLQGQGKVLRSQVLLFVVEPLLMIGLILWFWVRTAPANLTVTQALTAVAMAHLFLGGIGYWLATKVTPFSVVSATSSIPRNESRHLSSAALALGAITGVHLINNSVDVIMLGYLRTSADVGLYKAAAEVASVTAFGLAVVAGAVQPRIAELFTKERRIELQTMLTKSARITSVFAGGALVFFVVAGEPLLRFLFDASYVGGTKVLIILSVGHFVSAFFGLVALALNMMGHQKNTLIVLSLAVLLNVFLNGALVPAFGLEGAAIATSVALIFWNVVLALVLKEKTGYFAGPLKISARGLVGKM